MKVFRSAEAIQTRKSHLQMSPTRTEKQKSPDQTYGEDSGSMGRTPYDSGETYSESHEGLSCFPVCSSKKGEVLGCLFVEHHSNSSPRRDQIAQRAALRALLSIAANTLLDVRIFLRQDKSIRTLQAERESLVMSSHKDRSLISIAKLNESMARVSNNALMMQPNNHDKLATTDNIDAELERFCTQTRNSLSMDRVYVIYGRTPAASESWVTSNTEFASYKGAYSHDIGIDGASNAQSETDSISGMTGITNMS